MVTPSEKSEQSVWSVRFVGADGHRQVESAVAAAELSTSAEIVPMLVRRSSAYGQIITILLLGFFAAFIVMEDIFSFSLTPTQHLFVLVDLAVAAWVLSLSDTVKRWLLPDADMEQQVMRRAEAEFLEAGLYKTDGATGILIFVSLMEHRAVVLADKGISDRLPAETWQSVVDDLIARIKRRDAAGGFAAAVEACGKIAAPHFPSAKSDQNELRNTFVVKD